MQHTSQNTKRLLLAGNINAGKSSIHCIIFGDHPQRVNFETYKSLDFEQFDTKFLSDLSVRLWELNMYRTTEQQRGAFLQDTSAVVYVIDAHSHDLKNEFNSLERGLECLKKYAPESKVFILIHQCDRLEAMNKEEVLEKCKEEIERVEKTLEFSFEKVFQTSIWDDTLYRVILVNYLGDSQDFIKAWCEISQGLTQNREVIRETLKYLADTCSYDEVALFDMRTFLILDRYEKEIKDEVEKYERLGTVIKHFKINCKKGIDMKSLLVSTSKFTAYISVFTPNTYIMAITFDTKTQPSVIELNVKEAKKFYGKRVGEPAEFMNEYIL